MDFYNSNLDTQISIYFDGSNKDSQIALLIPILTDYGFESDDEPYFNKASPFLFSFDITSEPKTDKSCLLLINKIMSQLYHESLFLSSNFNTEPDIDKFLININIIRKANTHEIAIYASDANFASEPRVIEEKSDHQIGEVTKDGITEVYPEPTITPPEE